MKALAFHFPLLKNACLILQRWQQFTSRLSMFKIGTTRLERLRQLTEHCNIASYYPKITFFFSGWHSFSHLWTKIYSLQKTKKGGLDKSNGQIRTLWMGTSCCFVQSNVQIRRYWNKKRERLEPYCLEDSFLMSFYRLGRLVQIVPDVKQMDHRICRARCQIQTIRGPSLIYQCWLGFTAFLLPPEGM